MGNEAFFLYIFGLILALVLGIRDYFICVYVYYTKLDSIILCQTLLISRGDVRTFSSVP